MKKQTGIWMDKSKAIVVTFNGGKHSIKTIQSQMDDRYNTGDNESGSWMGGQHLSDENKINERLKHRLELFFNEISSLIDDVHELYLFGPADTKTKFKNRLNSKKKLSFELLKVETADSMTDNQIVAKVRSFYEV